MKENFDIQNKSFRSFEMDVRDARYKKIYRYLSKKTPGRLLEIGCANGSFLRLMKAKGWDVTGADITSALVKKCKANELNVVQHDAQQPFPFRSKFDVIVAGEVIEHMVDADKFLKNCRDALKPGGTVIITTPNLAFIVNRVRLLFGKRPLFAYSDFHYKMFLLDDLKEKVSKRFKIKRVLGSHVLVSTRRGALFKPFETIADVAPSMSAHFIIIAEKR